MQKKVAKQKEAVETILNAEEKYREKVGLVFDELFYFVVCEALLW